MIMSLTYTLLTRSFDRFIEERPLSLDADDPDEIPEEMTLRP